MKYGLLLALLLIFFGSLLYAYRKGYESASSRITERVDTLYTPAETLRAPIRPPVIRYLPAKADSLPPDIEAARDTLEQDLSREDTLTLRTYETPVRDSLLEGVITTSVLGVMLRQQLSYRAKIPVVTRTLLPESSLHPLLGLGTRCCEGFPLEGYLGLETRRTVYVGSINPIEHSFGFGMLRRF